MHLWQKPYAQHICNKELIVQHGVIFAPFAHNARNADAVNYREFVNHQDFSSLRDYHHNMGYIYNTSSNIIKQYIEIFQSAPIGSLVVIPHRSYDKKADKNFGYLARIVGEPFFANINALDALYRNIEILNLNYPIQSGIRTSIKIYYVNNTDF